MRDSRGVVCEGSGLYSHFTSLQRYYSGLLVWSVEGWTPSCTIQPKSVDVVGQLVKILSSNKCQFSIKNGGHTPWSGAASINGGITIDMAGIFQITVSSDKKVASIGLELGGGRI